MLLASKIQTPATSYQLRETRTQPVQPGEEVSQIVPGGFPGSLHSFASSVFVSFRSSSISPSLPMDLFIPIFSQWLLPSGSFLGPATTKQPAMAASSPVLPSDGDHLSCELLPLAFSSSFLGGTSQRLVNLYFP